MLRKILKVSLSVIAALLVVLATDIPVSATAINVGCNTNPTATYFSAGNTVVPKTTPATGTGTIDTVVLNCQSNMANTEVGLFYVVSGNNLTSRSNATLGTVTAGSPQTFSGLTLSVTTGDYLGFYNTSGYLYGSTSTGDPRWYDAADDIPSTNKAFTYTAATRLYNIYGTGTTSTPSLANTPTSKAFGVVQPSTTYYAKGSAPSNPVVDGDCTFTITNDGTIAIDISVKATNFTGGGGWTLGAPDGTHARLAVYYSGENPASGVVLTTSNQAFYSNLAASGTKLWDFKFETATSFADGTAKSSTITLTAAAH